MNAKQQSQIETATRELQEAEHLAARADAAYGRDQNTANENNMLAAYRALDNARAQLRHAKTIGYEVRVGDHTCGHLHHTEAAAANCHNRLLAWRCGICGNKKSGWGRCSHGAHQRVCSATWYNSRVVAVYCA